MANGQERNPAVPVSPFHQILNGSHDIAWHHTTWRYYDTICTGEAQTPGAQFFKLSWHCKEDWNIYTG